MLYALGDGQWDIPALRVLLETILPERTAMDGFEVDHDFPGSGPRIMLLNARKVLYDERDTMAILLAFRDVTARRASERQQALLLQRSEALRRQNEMLLEEMRHRVANSLQIIASVLLLKARAILDETRFHLNDAHKRVLSVAAVQQHLDTGNGLDQIDAGIYLEKLCAGLGASMIGDNQRVTITVDADSGMIASAKAVNLGLIVTELVINALKYAFPGGRDDAEIAIRYAIQGDDWTLTVADNGVGTPLIGPPKADGGLGTTIIAALAKQLEARVTTASTANGFAVTVTRELGPGAMSMAAAEPGQAVN